MAAPLKVQTLLGLRASARTCLCVTRSGSSYRDGRNDGPPPWAARNVPTGKTFYAIQLAKMQNKEIWRKRMEYVNRPWKKILKDYNKVVEKRRQEAGKETGVPHEVIPQEERPLLLMVKRIGALAGQTKTVKEVIKQLGLNERYEIKIFKNSHSSNMMLRKVSHLLEIYPVTFPYGPPESEEDLDYCHLTDNGQFIVKKKLQTTDQLEGETTVTEELPDQKYEMTQEYIDRRLELRKMKYQIAQEYFQTKYVFEKNQDGKEWRYKGDHRLGYDKIWH
ncbi:Mitochondrial ribosomal protein L30 [Mactra antiquata]